MEMTRRGAIELLGGGALSLARATGASRPNIVLFYADDLDFDELGFFEDKDPKLFPSYTGMKRLGMTTSRAYEDSRMLTPHIDGLAREGAIFTRFYITSSVCTPSRCSLLTGRYASRSPGLLRQFPAGGPASISWNTPIYREESNLAKSLHEMGYATGVVGKWHNFERGHAEVDRTVPEDADPREPGVAARLRARYQQAVESLSKGYGFDFVDRINIGNTEQVRPAGIRGQNLEWHVEGALEFLKRYHSRPFFLYFPLPVPHGQYFDFRRLDPLATTAGMLDKAPEVQPSRASVFERLKKEGIDPRNAMATWMDDSVGVILKQLDDYGVADNTIVLFISDNPTRGKNTNYETTRVPAIIKWPGRVKPGARVDSITANIDVAATLIEAAGGTAADDMRTDGRSFLGQLTGKPEPADWRRELLLEIDNSRAAVTRRWKYIATRPRLRPPQAEAMRADAEIAAKTGRPRTVGWNRFDSKNNRVADWPHYFDLDQLYDLDADVYERTNLASEPARAAVLDDMKQRLSALLKPLPHTFAEFKRS